MVRGCVIRVEIDRALELFNSAREIQIEKQNLRESSVGPSQSIVNLQGLEGGLFSFWLNILQSSGGMTRQRDPGFRETGIGEGVVRILPYRLLKILDGFWYVIATPAAPKKSPFEIQLISRGVSGRFDGNSVFF